MVYIFKEDDTLISHILSSTFKYLFYTHIRPEFSDIVRFFSAFQPRKMTVSIYSYMSFRVSIFIIHLGNIGLCVHMFSDHRDESSYGLCWM